MHPKRCEGGPVEFHRPLEARTLRIHQLVREWIERSPVRLSDIARNGEHHRPGRAGCVLGQG
jgi:hypothetical protein